jgi:FKBP-type peptidyl-prolyl cis-trans isomerase FklB
MVLALLLLAGGLCAAEEPPLKTQKERISYVMGMYFGRDMLRQGIDLNADIFARGLRDALTGAKPAISDQEAQQIINVFGSEIAAKKQAAAKKAGEENSAKEQKFLAENGAKPGVQTLPSGLQYKVLKEGSGRKPTLYDTVTVNYRGTLIDGTEFDSSYKRNAPATFPVSGVIPGWTEALQLMKVGSTWQVFIPSKLAYGEAGGGTVIPPNAALIFEVELLSIGDGSSGAAGQPKAPAGGTGAGAAGGGGK